MDSKFIIRILITALAVLIVSWFLKGVYINNPVTAIIVAIILAFFNSIVKPVLVFLTLPITVFTLGLFLIVINILIVKWTSALVNGFRVDGWLPALLFSLLLSFVTSLLSALTGNNKNK